MAFYPFDSTGTSANNRITNEKHTIASANGIDSWLIVPEASPFFEFSLVVLGPDKEPMIKDKDYFLVHRWEQGSSHVMNELYGGIAIAPEYSSGVITLAAYNTIGGEFTIAPYKVITSGLVSLTEAQMMDYSTVPASLPSIPHSHILTSELGVTEVLRKFDEIISVLQNPLPAINIDDIKDFRKELITPILGNLAQIKINLMNENNNSSLLGTLVNKVNSLLPFSPDTFVNSLNYYSIPLAGLFTIKVGTLKFFPNAVPLELEFLEPFENKCLFVNGILYDSESGLPNNDVVNFGSPSSVSVPFNLILSPDNVSERALMWFSLGV